MDHIAHIKNTGGLDNESVTEETVSEHCKKTALLARSYSAPFNIESTVFVSALLHDSGKLNNDFDGYIKHANGIKRGEIDHSYAGAKFLLELVLSATQNAKSGKRRDKPKLSGINQHKADCYAVCCVSQVVYPARFSKVSCQKNRCVFASIFLYLLKRRSILNNRFKLF